MGLVLNLTLGLSLALGLFSNLAEIKSRHISLAVENKNWPNVTYMRDIAEVPTSEENS